MIYVTLAVFLAFALFILFVVRDDRRHPAVLPSPDYREGKIEALKRSYVDGFLDLSQFEAALDQQFWPTENLVPINDFAVFGGCGTIIATPPPPDPRLVKEIVIP